MDRRRFIATTSAAASLAACGQRHRGGDVVAAGQPAALLIWGLAPARLAGWPRRLPAAALDLLGPAARLDEVGALNLQGAAPNLEALAATRPALVLDYGDLSPGFAQVGKRVRARLNVPYHLLDGRLRTTPATIDRAGQLLGSRSAPALATTARTILAEWAQPPGSGPSFYYARGSDGLETGFAGSLATEVLEGAGYVNIATGPRPTIARTSLEQVLAWDPEIVVTLDRAFAAGPARRSPWIQRRDGRRRRVLLLPDLPFGWVDRPPSLNRLIGCAWLSGDSARAALVAEQLYHRPIPLRPDTVPQWLD